MNCKIVL